MAERVRKNREWLRGSEAQALLARLTEEGLEED
jgi:hypothetical protein